MHRVMLAVPLAAFLGAAVRARAIAQADFEITGTSIGGVRVCQPLDSVNALYANSQDTTFFGGASGTRWPGKVITLGQGGRILVEASYVDRSRVWRISTTSSAFATASGLHVGSSIADVLATGERMTFRFPEGYLVAHLTRAGVSFEVDDSSAARFYRTWGGRGSPLSALDRSARIKRIFVSGGCRRGRAGS